MFSISIPPSFAYLIFALLTLVVWAVCYGVFPATRKPQLWMSSWGLIGGPFINIIYQGDFWKPIPLVSWLPIESALFGFGYLGIVTALTFRLAGSELESEPAARCMSRREKATILTMFVFVGLSVHTAGFVSVFASAISFFIVAFALTVWSRNTFGRFVLYGAVTSLIALGVLLVGFVFVLAGNGHALGQELSTFYVARGAAVTALNLALWAAAFGAFAGPFYLWAKNLRPAR